jgi:hypothetical protein
MTGSRKTTALLRVATVTAIDSPSSLHAAVFLEIR